MKKVLKKYGVLVLLYVIVIAGALLLSSRLNYLNERESNNPSNLIAINK